jgi:hypothetical protein
MAAKGIKNTIPATPQIMPAAIMDGSMINVL